jgi:hypothetical protein
VTCECGCGGQAKPGNRFIHAHNHRGVKHSAEWITKQATGLKAAWASGKFETMRKHSPEFIERRIAPIRGKSHPPEFGKAVSAALTGRKLSESHRIACSKTWLSGPQNLTPEAEAKRRAGISKARTGTHGFGRTSRDRPDHCKALHWIVRDSRGVVLEFDNLQSWCRQNEWRFLPDDRPMSKLKLWQRAVGGFNNMQRTDRKGQHQWKGWTLVSVIERKDVGAPDLLGRVPGHKI